jgi:hypothetical protein
VETSHAIGLCLLLGLLGALVMAHTLWAWDRWKITGRDFYTRMAAAGVCFLGAIGALALAFVLVGCSAFKTAAPPRERPPCVEPGGPGDGPFPEVRPPKPCLPG